MSTIHPRRTSAKIATPTRTLTPPQSINMSLAKGATFHSPPMSPIDDASAARQPQRSETTLGDVVDAHRRRIELALNDIDRTFAAINLEDKSPTSLKATALSAAGLSKLGKSVDEPYGPIMQSVMEKEKPTTDTSARSRGHGRGSSRDSRSGKASSVGSVSRRKSADTPPTSFDEESPIKEAKPSAITRSVATIATVEHLPRLSAKASNRIREHVLGPLLAKSSLKEFHDVVRDCPKRIHAKEIVCLRDLEKTLVFLAPSKAKSAASYLDFCVTSIQCVQATVEFLNERERTRPTDRPYTSGYFIDLVEQIKIYAQQVQEAQDKMEKGEKVDEMAAERTDEIKLLGGLSKNGLPAELVRVKKNGKAISMATGQVVDMADDIPSPTFKRNLSIGLEDEDEVLRSMARRKRSSIASELAPKRCREPGCDKEFKRPCDLTKHEKTHSRPWKCPVETCKYHDYGWPTEKEMDRHHNDKHSSAPPLYECHFKPCPYRSKRESNCKQHMEKAHGWQYVRSKNNGKQRDTQMHDLPTPQLTDVHTPSSDGNMVHTPSDDGLGGYDSGSGYRSGMLFPTCQPDMDLYAPHTAQVEWSPISDRSHSVPSAHHSPTYVPHVVAALPSQFDDASRGGYSNNLDWNMYDNEDLYNAHVRLPPTQHHASVFKHIQQPFASTGVSMHSIPAPSISPVDHGHHMMYHQPASLHQPESSFDEFRDYKHKFSGPMMSSAGKSDFQLYPLATTAGMMPTPTTMMGGMATTATCGGAYAPHQMMPQVHENGAFPAVSAQELLDFYSVSTAAAIGHGGVSVGMTWPTMGVAVGVDGWGM